LVGVIMTSWSHMIIYLYGDKGNRYSQQDLYLNYLGNIRRKKIHC